MPEKKDMVVGHNDGQENNILMSFSNPNNLCLIDFEYASWSWRELDIANYVNETICDNNFPEGCGIGYIFEN
jgi:thiamine kinase-like enzyme